MFTPALSTTCSFDMELRKVCYKNYTKVLSNLPLNKTVLYATKTINYIISFEVVKRMAL